MNVFKSWCQSRHLENVNMETMEPEELDNILSKFCNEVKKRDGDDNEPESLKIMQSAIERYLKEKNYPLSIVRSREFHNSQEILHSKAISLRQQGKGQGHPTTVFREISVRRSKNCLEFSIARGRLKISR